MNSYLSGSKPNQAWFLGTYNTQLQTVELGPSTKQNLLPDPNTPGNGTWKGSCSPTTGPVTQRHRVMEQAKTRLTRGDGHTTMEKSYLGFQPCDPPPVSDLSKKRGGGLWACVKTHRRPTGERTGLCPPSQRPKSSILLLHRVGEPAHSPEQRLGQRRGWATWPTSRA